MSYTADVALSFFEWCKVKFLSLQKLDFVFFCDAYCMRIVKNMLWLHNNYSKPADIQTAWKKFLHLEEPTIFGNQNLVDCFMYQGKHFAKFHKNPSTTFLPMVITVWLVLLVVCLCVTNWRWCIVAKWLIMDRFLVWGLSHRTATFY